jgi:hypothetical protein
MNFEVSAKSGNGMGRMIYYSIAKLPLFEQYGLHVEEIIRELGKIK